MVPQSFWGPNRVWLFLHFCHLDQTPGWRSAACLGSPTTSRPSMTTGSQAEMSFGRGTLGFLGNSHWSEACSSRIFANLELHARTVNIYRCLQQFIKGMPWVTLTGLLTNSWQTVAQTGLVQKFLVALWSVWSLGHAGRALKLNHENSGDSQLVARP